MIALDLFAGAGGWDVAAGRLTIHALGVENMPEARATREAAGLETVFSDVWDGLRTPAITPSYTMLIASPPCQRYSPAGKGEGRKNFDRVRSAMDSMAEGVSLTEQVDLMLITELDALVLVPLAYAMRDLPTYIALEQVPPALPVWLAMADILGGLGYSVAVGNLQAEQYGVPQTRKRAILVARRDGKEARLPEPTHSRYFTHSPDRLDPGVLPWVSMAEALGRGLAERPSPTIRLRSNYGTGGVASNRGEREIERPAPTITSKANRMKWNYPAPTVAGDARISPRGCKHFGPGCCAANPDGKLTGPQFPQGTTRLTIEEAAILQTFPVDYPFQGGNGKKHLQNGNAVPPLLAEAILRELISQ